MPRESDIYEVRESTAPEVRGVYHKIEKGQTVWRIAKAYQVSLEDIIEYNKIPDIATVEENQLLFIPGADETQEIPVFEEETDDGFAWPVEGKVIHFFRELKKGQFNKGIDILGDRGESVKAARSGRVAFADALTGYGRTVVIDHGDGFYTVYANNENLLVDTGDIVVKNTEIAELNDREDFNVLHFQIRKEAVEQNPLHYLP